MKCEIEYLAKKATKSLKSDIKQGCLWKSCLGFLAIIAFTYVTFLLSELSKRLFGNPNIIFAFLFFAFLLLVVVWGIVDEYKEAKKHCKEE